MLLLVLACTCAGAPPVPDAAEPIPAAEPVTAEPVTAAPPLPPSRKPLCATPLGCGLLIHYRIDTVRDSVCGWCGEDNPALCGDTWLPNAAGAELPRCGIYQELERCILQHSSTKRFADLPDMPQANILTLQEREDGRVDCVE
ncbi:MAG: hypothetical protein ACI8RZ_000610 [Myxococcota bacterium]|jgi:hypothetical protein